MQQKCNKTPGQTDEQITAENTDRQTDISKLTVCPPLDVGYNKLVELE